MKQLTNQSTGKHLLMVAALVLLTAAGGCKRATSNSIGVALGSSGVMDGYAATGSTLTRVAARPPQLRRQVQAMTLVGRRFAVR